MKKINKMLSLFIVVLGTLFGVGAIKMDDFQSSSIKELVQTPRSENYFQINKFVIANDSITTNSFEFWIDIELVGSDSFSSVANDLVLSSNLKVLDTKLEKQVSELYLYRVSKLDKNKLYNNFSISMFGHEQIEFVDGIIITKKTKLTSEQILGIVLGVLSFILIIVILILLFLRFSQTKQNETIDENNYHEYHIYIDEHDNRFEWINDEWVPEIASEERKQ